MAKYLVTVNVTTKAVIEETYEVEALNCDDAENKFLEGEGELVNEMLINYSNDVDEETVKGVQSI